MKIWVISDTHGFHNELTIPEGIDMIIHAGDFSNSKSPAFNYNEATEFLIWYDNIKDVKYKLLCCGNHDTSIEAGLIDKQIIKSFYPSLTYLFHETIEIEGLKIFGSPYTPEFHQWAFNVKRQKLFKYWECIEENTDIVITHTPPMGILDLASRQDESGYEQTGCRSLMKHIERVNPKLHVFGHIHSERGIKNDGIREIGGLRTKFVNAAMLELRSNKKVNNGFIVEI